MNIASFFKGTSNCTMLLFQMAAFNIQEALIWKEKIETAIDQVCVSWKQFHINLPLKSLIHGFNCSLTWVALVRTVLLTKYCRLSRLLPQVIQLYYFLCLMLKCFGVWAFDVNSWVLNVDEELNNCCCHQQQESRTVNGNKYVSFEFKPGMDNGRTASSSDHESQWVLRIRSL